MKQVLFLKSAPGLPVHGADISVFERIHLLRKHGWDGKIISTGRIEHAKSFLDIISKLSLPCSYRPEENLIVFSYAEVECFLFLGPQADHFVAKKIELITNFFDSAIDKIKPDALMGNVRDPIALRYLSDISSYPVVMFLTEDEYPKNDSPNAREFFELLKKIKTIVVASEFLQDSLFSQYGIRAQLLTNTVATSLYKIKKDAPGRYISMMHPYIHKGVEVFLQIVESMPEREFMLMAGTGAEYRSLKPRFMSLPNLTLASYTKDTSKVYENSRIIIVPSLWQEAFSRVIIEALCTGTPVIASGRGGMRQAGGDAPYYVQIETSNKNSGHAERQSYNVSSWIKTIELLDNLDEYNAASERSLKRIVSYEKEMKDALLKLVKLLSQ